MYKTSEWVSTGHPDKLADFISSFILDRYIERDPHTRFALEVQIKDNCVTLGGEITSTADFSPEDIAAFVKTAVTQVGYTSAYQKRFGRENIICGDDIEVTQHIGRQSPDIAQGVDADGWGDQGIFWGMAVNSPETKFMPKDWWLARKIGKHLFDTRYAGLDIKTQVTLRDDKIDEIVVAVPMTEKHYDYDIANMVQFCCDGSRDYKLIINGTGRYLKHGPVGDCGTTGRKLAVDRSQTTGSFLAAALNDALGGGGSEAERTANATEQVAKTTKETNRILKKMGKGGSDSTLAYA